MTFKKLMGLLLIGMVVAPVLRVEAQVQTPAPPVVPGAADRVQNLVLPFFSSNLCFEAGCRRTQ